MAQEPLRSESKPLLHEDWTVVVLGFLIIILSFFFYTPISPVYSWSTINELSDKVFTSENFLKLLTQFAIIDAIVILAIVLTGKQLKPFFYAFPIIFVLTVAALILAGNSEVKALNLEAVIFSLTIGLIIGNAFELPQWFRDTLSAELFVKIGLVLLGTGIIFSDILKAGFLGLIQALLVVLSVWYFAFWICRKFKLDEELSMMLSSAVSICGVSAAIATAGAIKGDTKKLSYVISLVLVTAIPMMIFMPYIASYFGFSQEVTGAWLGGTIDTTGAVAAAGTLVGDTALKISTIVKFSQNLLLGIAAFAISVYWTYAKKEPGSKTDKPTLGIIWERFPKFVLGFMAASLIFSFIVPPEKVLQVKESLKSIQMLWFALAFTSIGLETRFSDLFNTDNRKPLYAFLISQAFNILITLLIASILFGWLPEYLLAAR
jgi:uncharacterized integral membrane protein (TIGR00698 family)